MKVQTAARRSPRYPDQGPVQARNPLGMRRVAQQVADPFDFEEAGGTGVSQPCRRRPSQSQRAGPGAQLMKPTGDGLDFMVK